MALNDKNFLFCKYLPGFPESAASRSRHQSPHPVPHAAEGTYRNIRERATRLEFSRGHRHNREAFGDLTRASLGVSLLPLLQARRPNQLFRVRQRKLIVVRCHLLGKGGAPVELIRTLVIRDSGMRSNSE
ncbi:hypothetical protein EVAR_41144_1 [Eumeta japonica]|uniref:Uncharacterized protein n=1 Tax=Eumeta variegata TaxID=151549 RepID=A0A4C1YAD1_EUMVA|nr:hypothetical protein EVAR_41144_1 [Eumeta japonica]